MDGVAASMDFIFVAAFISARMFEFIMVIGNPGSDYQLLISMYLKRLCVSIYNNMRVIFCLFSLLDVIVI
jgi:hypothetical protein